jgi:hypothetical protein
VQVIILRFVRGHKKFLLVFLNSINTGRRGRVYGDGQWFFVAEGVWGRSPSADVLLRRSNQKSGASRGMGVICTVAEKNEFSA